MRTVDTKSGPLPGFFRVKGHPFSKVYIIIFLIAAAVMPLVTLFLMFTHPSRVRAKTAAQPVQESLDQAPVDAPAAIPDGHSVN